MDYGDLTDDALYRMVKGRVPEIPIDRVDDSNRKTVIAVLRVTERIGRRKQAGTH